MIKTEPVAVLAGTPVDTRMGAELLERNGFQTLSFPAAENPIAQTAFQISSPAEKAACIKAILDTAVARGCRRVFVYCNSLSGAVDFRPLAVEKGLRIVTPLEVYRALAGQYRSLGVIAANAQGLAGIERVLTEENPGLELWGAAMLPAVLSVEAGLAPEELVRRHHLGALTGWFQSVGAEALVLGCTHFPYFKEALAAQTSLPLIDPAAEMLRVLEQDE